VHHYRSPPLAQHAVIAETERIPLKEHTDGVIRVGGTRVPIDTVVTIFEQGATAEEIAQRFPTLALADVYFAIRYYLRHRSEVEEYMQARRQRSDEVRQQNQQSGYAQACQCLVCVK
jgi:uncharacterized protein (DUF433 family)